MVLANNVATGTYGVDLATSVISATVGEENPTTLAELTEALNEYIDTLSGATALNEFAAKFVAGDEVALTGTVTLKLIAGAGTNQSGR